MKVCERCGKEYTFDRFPIHSVIGEKVYYRSKCYACLAAESRDWYKNNRDNRKLSLKKWYYANKEKNKTYVLKYNANKKNNLGYLPKSWLYVMKLVYGFKCAKCQSKTNIQI